MMMHSDCEKILLSQEQLKERIARMGKKISTDFDESEPIIAIGILKGSVIFMADLVREIEKSVELEFMAVSSYGASTKSSGAVKILKDLDIDISGKNVLIIEDIIDSGITLSYLKEMLLKRNPKSLKICTLLNKPERRKADVKVDYIGFDIPDEFVIGYGLDYDNKYRNLPYIGILKREIYE
jgi:hypoxanthine phosphoribosyltransferase